VVLVALLLVEAAGKFLELLEPNSLNSTDAKEAKEQ
jgi:hypothetical protein